MNWKEEKGGRNGNLKRERERKKGRGEKKRGGRLCLPVAERNRVDGIISHSPTS